MFIDEFFQTLMELPNLQLDSFDGKLLDPILHQLRADIIVLTIAFNRLNPFSPLIEDCTLPDKRQRLGEKRLKDESRYIAATLSFRGRDGHSSWTPPEDDVQDHTVIFRIGRVEVLLPIGKVVMDFDVAMVKCSSDADPGVSEIGASISIWYTDVDDLDVPTIEGLQLVKGEVLVLPDEVEKTLVDMPGGSHGNQSK
jgi:hypothetical protein